MLPSHGSDFAVVERELVDEEENYIPRLFVTSVPNLSRQQVKDAIDKAGRLFGVEGRRWLNHTILPGEKWPESITEQFGHRDTEHISYEELEAESRGEKRVTLRMERALHAELTEHAEEQGLSFNDYCLKVLRAEFADQDSVQSHATRIRPMAQRDAMRALHQVYGGDKTECVNGWIRLYEENAVTIGRNPDRNPPAWYAQQLWKDGENKFWFKDRVSEDIITFVRSRIAAWKAEGHQR